MLCHIMLMLVNVTISIESHDIKSPSTLKISALTKAGSWFVLTSTCEVKNFRIQTNVCHYIIIY